MFFYVGQAPLDANPDISFKILLLISNRKCYAFHETSLFQLALYDPNRILRLLINSVTKTGYAYVKFSSSLLLSNLAQYCSLSHYYYAVCIVVSHLVIVSHKPLYYHL